MTKEHFAELLAKAKALAAAAKKQAEVDAAVSLGEQAATCNTIDTTNLGISDESIKTDAGKDQAVDVIRDVIANISETPADTSKLAVQETVYSLGETEEGKQRTIGVARDVVLNSRQQEAHDIIVKTADDLVVIGAAGTGKTTSMRKTTRSLIDTGKVRNLGAGTKWLQSGLPGIVVVSFTRKAVNNIRHAVADEIKPHTQTLHKFLEFAPIFYEIEDPAKPGSFKKTMRFEPQRNASNPLPPDLKVVIIEESSMVSVDLHEQWKSAMPHTHQTIYIGDIQQLPPVFGLAILGFKMLDTKIVELTEVYRQALESPIISLAWKLLEGNPHEFSSKVTTHKVHSKILNKEVTRIKVPALEALSIDTPSGAVKFQVWQKQLSADDGLNTFVKQAVTWADQNYYHPADDIILCPYNKAFGTIEINKGIMQHLGVKREAVVHEIIAGFEKLYLAVGDRVLYDKEDAFITNIAINSEYLGKRAQPASKHLDRWGHYREQLTDAEKLQAAIEGDEMDLEAMEKFMASVVDESEDRTLAASHIVTLRYAYSEPDEPGIELQQAGEINNLLGGYAITVHKAQGSEWDRVFFVMSHTHAVMNQRELLYTAVTRAAKFLHIICEPNTFEKGVKSQRIKGNTLLEKAEFFKGKETEYEKKRKEREDQQQEGVVFTPGKYKGEAAPVIPAIQAAPVRAKLTKFADFVPDSIQLEAQQNLTAVWQQAKNIWGEGLGEKPALDFKLQNSKYLGMSFPVSRRISLNPLWCILAAGDERIKQEMLVNTLKHEAAHQIETIYSHGSGHGSGWRMTMQLLGLKPDVYYMGDTLPPWTEGYKDAVSSILSQQGVAEIEDEEDEGGEA